MNKLILIAGISVIAGAAQAQVTIANWNFENTTVGTTAVNDLPPISADSGLGSLTSHHATAATFSTPAGNGSAKSISANTYAVGDYWQFQVATTGLNNISVSYDQTGSNTGPRDWIFQYSTDGTNFTDFGSQYSITNDAWSPTAGVNPVSFHSFDFTGISAVENAATVYFRIVDNSTVSINGGTVAAGGTGRLDNITVSANPVPEPASMAALGLGALALIRKRKARKA